MKEAGATLSKMDPEDPRPGDPAISHIPDSEKGDPVPLFNQGEAIHTSSGEEVNNSSQGDNNSSEEDSSDPGRLSRDREDVQVGEILPPAPVLVEAPDLEFGVGFAVPEPVVISQFSKTVAPAPPEEPPPGGGDLDPIKNNSPQRSEQVREGEYDCCPNPVVVARTDRKTGEVDTVEISCDRKWCPYCGPKMKRRYVAHFSEQFSELPSLKFVTLTLDPKAFGGGVGIDPTDFAESRKYLLHIWERRFVKRVKRRSEGKVTYVASVERHESGQAHLHVVMSCTLNEAELRDQWFESGGGVVMEATPLLSDSHVARKVGYVMKYTFQESFEQSDGRNAVFCSEGVGYHSEEAQEKRKAHFEGESEGDDTEEWDSERYEYDPPPGAGHADNGDRVTDEEKARFDRIADGARSTTYVNWEGENAPREGTRIRYDRETGETIRDPVREVIGSDGRPEIREV
jgi:hypothetical protein